MIALRKIQAGSLQFVVFIGVVVAILLATFVTLVYVNLKFSKQTDLLVKSIENANRGLQMSLFEDYPYRDTIKLNVENSGIEDLKLFKSFWGIYETATTVSTIKKNRIVNHAFIGRSSEQRDRIELYLAENRQPLVIVGNTFIKGKNYIPKKGIKSGTISGVSYYGDQLLYGSSSISSSNLPGLNPEITFEIERLRNIPDEVDSNLIVPFVNSKSLKNSFMDDLKIIYHTEMTQLENIELTGHIIVYSEKKIIVKSSSRLTDIVLVAPEIEIQSDVEGNFQAIASENISVAENSRLNYPSALVLLSRRINTSEKKYRDIVLSKNSFVNGQIIVDIPKNEKAKFEAQLKLFPNSIVEGEVYCNQNVEHLGIINGSLYAKNFIARQAGSIYINHIYNGRIDTKALSKDYVGISFEKPSAKNIIKWGY